MSPRGSPSLTGLQLATGGGRQDGSCSQICFLEASNGQVTFHRARDGFRQTRGDHRTPGVGIGVTCHVYIPRTKLLALMYGGPGRGGKGRIPLAGQAVWVLRKWCCDNSIPDLAPHEKLSSSSVTSVHSPFRLWAPLYSQTPRVLPAAQAALWCPGPLWEQASEVGQPAPHIQPPVLGSPPGLFSFFN